MCTKLNLKKQVRLYEGDVIDLGNDVRYHCTKCLAPSSRQFGKVEPIFEMEYIQRGSYKHKNVSLKVPLNVSEKQFTIG